MTYPYDGLPEAWAVEWGEDRHGVFAGFAIGNVVQRMRWIPPGRFVMGSPETEVGRYDDEVQHEVEIENGFWLGDTPVTQALWEAVMGSNPSQFKSLDRPVEMVSWDDCQDFFMRLNEVIPSLGTRLPTEAEWEYACRATTTTATWVGDLKILGEHHAPLLDPIACYAGNCGVDYDLPAGFDMTRFREKQYDFSIGGTRQVAKKAPNPWGLYDMLGNVYEWCEDVWRNDPRQPSSPPLHEERMSERVLRGGAWFSDAKHLRAARRRATFANYRVDRIGFRLACGG